MTISGPENEDKILQEHGEITGIEGLDVDGFLQYLNDLDTAQQIVVADTTRAVEQTTAEIQTLEDQRAVLVERRIVLQRSHNETTATHDRRRTAATIDKLHQYTPTLTDRFTDEAYQIYAAWKSLGDDEIARSAFDRLHTLRELLDDADIQNPKYLVMFSNVEDETVDRKRYSIYLATSKPLIGIDYRITSTLNPKINPVVKSSAYGFIEVSKGTYRDVSTGRDIDENSCTVLGGLDREYPGDLRINLLEENLYGVISKEELEESGLLSFNDRLETIGIGDNSNDERVKQILDIWQLRLAFGLPVDINQLKDFKRAYVRRFLPSHVLDRILEIEGIISPNNRNSLWSND